jgi:hypothetical protein
VQGLLRQGGQESQSPGSGSGDKNSQGRGPGQGGAAAIVCCMVDTAGPAAGGGGAVGYPVVPLVAVSEEGVSSHLKCLYKCVSAFVRGDPCRTNSRGKGRPEGDGTWGRAGFLYRRCRVASRTKEQPDPFYPYFPCLGWK